SRPSFAALADVPTAPSVPDSEAAPHQDPHDPDPVLADRFLELRSPHLASRVSGHAGAERPHHDPTVSLVTSRSYGPGYPPARSSSTAPRVTSPGSHRRSGPRRCTCGRSP